MVMDMRSYLKTYPCLGLRIIGVNSRDAKRTYNTLYMVVSQNKGTRILGNFHIGLRNDTKKTRRKWTRIRVQGLGALEY